MPSPSSDEEKDRQLALPRIGKKALNILSQGRVKLEATGGRAIYFSVEGDTGKRQVRFEPTKRKWSCDCPYVSLHPERECSHIAAAREFLRRKKEKRNPSEKS